MASDTLAELLGLDPGTPRPNVYQLFGLKDGESDSQVITAAINRTLRRLKASQGSSDPEAWKQAAAAVTKARKILTDADAKAVYDSKRSRRPRGEAIDDPLQGLLPQHDPLAAFDLSAAAERVATLRPPQPTISDSPSAIPAAVITAKAETDKEDSELETVAPPPQSDAVESPPTAVPSLPPRSDLGNSDLGNSDLGVSGLSTPAVDVPLVSRSAVRRRRRRGFPWAATILTVMVFGMLGGIGFGIYLLTDRERQAAQAGAATVPAALPQLPPQPPIDPVMGSLATEKEPTPGYLLPIAESEPNREQPAREPLKPSESPVEMVPEIAMTVPSPLAADPPGQPSEAAQKAGQAAIDAAKAAILENNWSEMKSLAAKAVEAAAGEEQKVLAQRLFQLADLADYYYHGLMQSLRKLNAGDQMELENVGIVGVVEASETTFAVQVNGRPKSFDFERIPFFVVDAIAKQSMDLSDPTTQAAKAIHQAVSVNATPEHRQQSLGWLAELPDTLQGAEPAELQEAIRELYPNL